MRSMFQYHSDQFKLVEEDTYATADDFQKLFAREMADLYRLSLHLIGDVEKAEICLIHAMRECFSSGSVSRKWAQKWARRMVVRNAIRIVRGTGILPADIPSEAGVGFYLQPTEHRIEALREAPAILDLPDFDRLVFVICVLERYSILECALLLETSPKEVRDARVRATDQVISPEQNHDGPVTPFRTSPYIAYSEGKLDG